MTPSHSFLHNTRYRSRGGFTLVETLIVVAISTFIVVIISKLQADVFSYNRTFSSSLSTADSAQKLLRPMMAEIRSASPSNNGSYPISSIGQYDFSFYSDIDNDGQKELVHYYASGTTLYKDVTNPTTTVPYLYNSSNKVTTTFITGIRNVSDSIPIFQYYGDDYTDGSTGEIVPGTGALEDVRLVKVTIKLDDNTNQNPIAFTVTSQVSIRNLKQ